MLSDDLGRMITAIVAAAGEGADSLRRSGNAVVLQDCSIEVMLDEAPSPSAQVRVRFAADPDRAGPQPV